jgi:aminoglycoside phosphotransferase
MINTLNKQRVKSFLSSISFFNYSIIPTEEGFSTEVFKLVKSNSILYLRILPQKENSEVQYTVHQLLLKKNVKVPGVTYLKRKAELFDSRDVMIVEEIKGKSVLETESELSNTQKCEILKEAGKELAKVNMVEVSGCGDIVDVKNNILIGDCKSYKEYTLDRIPSKLENLVVNKILEKEIADKISKYLSQNEELLNIGKTSFLSHGDFSLEHVFQNNGEYSGIIDFGDIRGTSKYHDMAHVYTFYNEYFEDLIKGYEEVYKLPEDYMKYVFIEALVFGIFKLNWVLENRPERVMKSKVFGLFKSVPI